MKHLLSFAIAFIAFSSFVHAQEINYFSPDQYGVTNYTEEIAITMPKETAYQFVEAWLNANIQATATPTKMAELISFPAIINTKKSYNPFSGTYTENLTFGFDISFTDGSVKLDMKNFGLQFFYEGWGSSAKIRMIGDDIREINAMKEDLANNSSLSKKEKIEIQSKIDDLQESVDAANKELNKRLNALRSRLK